MLIKAEKWLIDDSESYKIVRFNKCCDRMLEYCNTRLSNAYDSEVGMCVYSVVITREEPVAYEDFTTTEEDVIHYCPFCGEKIVIDIVNVLDQTAVYNSLKNESDLLCKKYNKTDSISEQRAINEEVQEIRKTINYLWANDNFPNQ